MKMISFVIPVFNEEKNIPVLYKLIVDICLSLSYQYEIIFVDDGSTDSSWLQILYLKEHDKKVKAISFFYNFGHQIALTAGYDYASGDAIISLDCDMQHPVALIPCMIEKWQAGYKVVVCKRKNSQESFFKKYTSMVYGYLFKMLSSSNIPEGVADFRLLDRSVLIVLRQCKERYRYLRGAVFSLGFSTFYLDYDQPKRLYGKTKYSFKKMIRLAFNGLVCFTTFPLRLVSYIGFFIVTISFIFLSYFVIHKLFLRTFAYLDFLMILSFSLIFIVFVMLWMVSEYIIRIYEIERNNPIYVIQKVVGFED